MSHVKQRLEERASIEIDDLSELADEVKERGEYITENGGGFIYRLKYEGKTIYPVITFDGLLKTVLGEDMVKNIILAQKYRVRNDAKVYKKKRRPRR